jgi:DALR anticodon binding domain
VSSNSFSSNYPGLQLFVKHWLHEAITIQAQSQHLDFPARPIVGAIHPIQPQITYTREIPVKLETNCTQISYVSAIALLLERSWNQPAVEIAQNLTERLVQTIESTDFEAQFSPFQLVWKSVLFEANSAGWITLKLSDKGLAKWLKILISFFQDLKNLSHKMNDWDENPQIYLRDSTALPHSLSEITYDSDLFRNSTDVLLAQHAHARCCSLLRLGMAEDLIQLTAFPRGQSIAEPLPWLDETASIRFQHSSEHLLIRQICQTLDEISLVGNFSEPERTLKQVGRLSQAFRRFYADCLIFNEVKLNNSALAQVRLGLVDLVRSLLYLLLEDGLGIPAPPEL